jgi:hypothetical protein
VSASAQTAAAAAIAAATPDPDPWRDDHETLAAALVAALEQLTVVVAARTADAGSYSYSYADMAGVVKLTRPVLARHGLVALTPLHDHADGLACTVVILHTSGERLDFGPFPFPHGRDAQATGSAVTYHRRYALVAALGMAAGDDDDGAAAKPRQPRTVSAKSLAKATLLDLCEGDKAKAKAAWVGIAGDNVQWNRDPAAEVELRWTEWVNEDPTEAE